MSYIVSQSRREIGLRRALGASTANLLKLVLGQGFMMTLAGVAVDVVAGVLLPPASPISCTG